MAKLEGVKTLDMVNGEITKVAYDGAEYVKTSEDVKAGDLFQLIQGHSVVGGDIGAFYSTSRYRDGDVIIGTKFSGNATVVQSLGYGVAFRKVSAKPAPDLEERVATLEKRVDAMSPTEPAYRKIDKADAKAGDFVKFDEDYDDYILADKYYEITEVDGAGDPQITDEDGDNYDTCCDDYEVYTLRQPEEKPAVEPLKVGDYAKVVSSGFALHQYKVGDVAQVVDFEDNFPIVQIKNKLTEVMNPAQLVRATDAEVAEAKAELERKAESEKWAKIGRNPGEFKNGDIVKVTGSNAGHAIGSIGEVEFGLGMPCVKVNGTLKSHLGQMTLITPVEARFDRA